MGKFIEYNSYPCVTLDEQKARAKIWDLVGEFKHIKKQKSRID